MSSRKPTLALTTPTTASFPAEALMSAASVRTPHSAISSNWREAAGLPSAGLPSAGLPSAGLSSAGLHSPMVHIKMEEGLIKTPISPPVAYMDFLKMHSPITSSPCANSPLASPANTNTNTSTAAGHTNTANSSRPRLLHRASISGPAKLAPSSLNATARAVANPAAASSASLASSSDEDSNNDAEDKDVLDSGPSTAASSTSSTSTDGCSCDRERAHKSPRIARINTSIPPSPFGTSKFPMSAPAIGRTTFPSLKIPISPAVSNNPSQINSPIRSPFSAKSIVASPFDWESALKARYAEFKSPSQHAQPGCTKCSSKAPTSAATVSTTTASSSSKSSTTTAAKTSIRHIREVVTRTVTYTPRMNPAPKGKKRKIECDEAAC